MNATHPEPEFHTRTTIVDGGLVIDTRVVMSSVLTYVSTGRWHRSVESEGTFIGDYIEDSGEPYFLFRDGRIGETSQGFFACPAANFDAQVLSAYGPYLQAAQAIHEGSPSGRIPTPLGDITHHHDPDYHSDTFYLTIQGRCRGYARTTTSPDKVWIEEIAVHPDHRREGIGAVLLETVLTHHTGQAFAMNCEPYNPRAWSDPDEHPSGGMWWNDLEDWYTRYGFRRAPGLAGCNPMLRPPGPLTDRADTK